MVTNTNRLQKMILNLRKCHKCAVELVTDRGEWLCPDCGRRYCRDSVVGFISRDVPSEPEFSRTHGTTDSGDTGSDSAFDQLGI